MLDLRSTGIVSSAMLLAILCVLPSTSEITPLWIISAGMHIADTLFHELGHALFYWLYGTPSIPMIFTIFGADQAGGMAMTWEHSRFVQAGAFALLAYGCYWTKENWEGMFIPLLVFSLLIVITSFTRFYEIIPLFMGHGGCMLAGGFFLFRGFIYLDARNGFERWLNVFFGFYFLYNNMYFSYALISDPFAHEAYSGHKAFGASANDFVVIADFNYGWTVRGVAKFAMAYGVLVMLGAYILAFWLKDRFYNLPHDLK